MTTSGQAREPGGVPDRSDVHLRTHSCFPTTSGTRDKTESSTINPPSLARWPITCRRVASSLPIAFTGGMLRPSHGALSWLPAPSNTNSTMDKADVVTCSPAASHQLDGERSRLRKWHAPGHAIEMIVGKE